MIFTWLNESNVQNFIHLRIVGRNMKDALGRVLNARNVHRNKVLADLLPLDGASAARRHVEDLRPQSAMFGTLMVWIKKRRPLKRTALVLGYIV